MKLSIQVFFSKYDHFPKETADLVTLTEEILYGKLRFCAVEAPTNSSWLIDI